MPVPLWCLFAACLLPYVWSTFGLVARHRQLGVDNKIPRQQLAQLEGWGARANAAQQNAWEALATFAPAVLCAHVTQADATWSMRLAIAWVAFRLLHGVVYLADVDIARTGAFFGATCCTAGLFFLSAGLF